MRVTQYDRLHYYEFALGLLREANTTVATIVQTFFDLETPLYKLRDYLWSKDLLISKEFKTHIKEDYYSEVSSRLDTILQNYENNKELCAHLIDVEITYAEDYFNSVISNCQRDTHFVFNKELFERKYLPEGYNV